MRSFGSAVLLACASLHPGSLAGQEVIVGEPIWNHGSEKPDEMPKSKGKLRPAYPKEVRATDEIAYVVIERYVGAKGEGRSVHAVGTQVAFQRAVEAEFPDWTMKPAHRNGQPVDAAIWVPVIFNPATSGEKRPDATPRLLKVQPVVVPHRPGPKSAPPLVPMKLSLDETGAVTMAVPQIPVPDDVAEAIVASVKQWQFAPARRGGHPVAAELVMPVICEPPPPANSAKRVPPKLIRRVEPEYPYAMRRFQLEGRVQLDFDVDVTGKTANPIIAQSNNPAFDEPALEALQKAVFEPATVDGKPVKTRMRQEIVFRMLGGGSDAFNITAGSPDKLPAEWRFDTAPKIRSAQLPIYPHDLRAAGVRGTASATMVIDERGRVVAVAGIKADRPEFGQALAAALETYQFDPALRAGKPVKSLLRYEQKFNTRELGDESGDWVLNDEKKHPEKIVPAGKLDHALKPISQRPPIFPVTLPAGVTGGRADVECLIDRNGRVQLPRVVEATDPAFGYAAVQALAAWRFDPPTVNGREVMVRVRLPVDFK